MGGLANSRHAPLSRRPRRDDLPPSPTATAHNNNDEDYPTALPRHPSPPLPPPPRPRRPSAAHELARYTKIVRRLKWKLPFLAQGYQRAVVDRVGGDAAATAEAELMFKLDFFEYYMLIERALVHLLGVFGVEVPRDTAIYRHDKKPGSGSGLGASIWCDGRGREEGTGQPAAARHRYHANVLAALDREDNPLHGTLGTGEVRRQLGRAKDLRNRWKTAGDEEDCEPCQRDHDRRSPARGTETEERAWRTKKIAAPLDSYRLEHMLEVIFQGFDEAFKVAEWFVRGGSVPGVQLDADMLGEDGRVIDWAAAADDGDQWEFMVDAMDWEAV